METAVDQEAGTTISVVVPVYQGAHCLESLFEEIEAVRGRMAERGRQLIEVVFVHDHGPDRSDRVLKRLEQRADWVRVVWLTRNFGQHPATVAGIAATSGDWVVTLDEDGLHDPADIETLLDRAVADGADLVYASAAIPPPHSLMRNATSRLAKRLFRLLAGDAGRNGFTSFRLIDGPFARNVVAYCGHDVYLDVALGWAVSEVALQPVDYRPERRNEDGSGYNLRKLLSHFRRLVLSSGTRPLRIISGLGLLATTGGLLTAAVVVWMRLFGDVQAQGWASVMITITIFSGLIMMALGVIAEYLSLAVTTAVGRPLYIVSGRPPRPGPTVILDADAPTVDDTESGDASATVGQAARPGRATVDLR